MRKREDGRRLMLKRELLRQLTTLTDDEVLRMVVGGWEGWEPVNCPYGRTESRCCK